MSGPTANEAVAYAMDEEFLKLYGVVLLGVLFSVLSTFALPAGGNSQLIGLLFLGLSTGAYLVGGVAVLHKLLAENV